MRETTDFAALPPFYVNWTPGRNAEPPRYRSGRLAGPEGWRRGTRMPLVTADVLAHRVQVGSAVLDFPGPVWSVALRETGPDRAQVAVGGLEEHDLDRSGGFFGGIDSFLYLYDLVTEGGETRLERTHTLDLSELGVITPKAMVFDDEGLLVTGFGGYRAARFDPDHPTRVETFPCPPGITHLYPDSAGGWWADAPLIDARLRIRGTTATLDKLYPDPSRGSLSRLGELLFFTELMAPANPTEGLHSRFTCETCHFEGDTDGRIHFTGRGTVHATTRTLRGLFNNKPHFSRALDPDLTAMVNAEFRVANAKSGNDPWFSLQAEDFPGVAEFTGLRGEIDPPTLRRALMTFLMEFTHEPNPEVWPWQDDRTRGPIRAAFTPEERQGAGTFAARCESCHAARLVTDAPFTRVAEDDWERLVLSEAGPIVWASSPRVRTGVEPYVHPEGARTPSLRRIATVKKLYFTNGSAATLDDVLERFRYDDLGDVWHDNGPANAEPLSEPEREALRAFLRLL